jgi:hypothetical protein
MTPLTGDEAIAAIRAETDTVLLAFSCGKDSIAAWLRLRQEFTVIPFYMWLVPGLEFVERDLAYFEDFFGTPITRYPNPKAYNNLRSGAMQAPANWAWLDSTPIPGKLTRQFVETVLKDELGLPQETYVATGVRAADSPMRLAAMRSHGPISVKQRKFHPIWDWRKERLMQTLHRSGVRLPVDYLLFGRSFDGLDRRFSTVIKRVYPDDYARIKAFYPLIDAEDYRAEFARRHDTRAKSDD